MQRATRNRLAIGIAFLVALLAFNAGVAYRKTRELQQSASLVSHTHEVQNALEELLSTMTDAETGQRGYVITGRDEYLAPYEKAVKNYDKELARIGELTADNPEQQADLPRMKELFSQKVAELERVIQLRREQGFEAAQAAVNTDAGRRPMDALRKLVDEMEDREDRLLAVRQHADEAAYRSALGTIVTSLVIGLLSFAAFVLLLQKHLKSVADAAARLFEQRELLRATLVSIGDGVIATDVAGRITLLNEIAQNLTGWGEADAKGMALEHVFKIVNEETRRAVSNPAIRALSEGKIVGLANHTTLISKNGVEWPIDDSAAPIKGQSGDLRGAVLVFREIKERKRHEQELERHAATLAEADHRKNEFLAMLAHELRNPLAPMCNALQLWPFVENDKGQLEELRTMMDRQLQLLIRLIDDLLDISRITRGKIELRRQNIDLATVVAGALDGVKPLIDARGHHVTVAFPERPLFVHGDVARLNQIFGNLLNNAAKYTGHNGVIWVNVQQSGDRAVVRIRDNGPGIPREMLEAIFDLFRQVDQTLSRSSGGLGIGLTLVKRLVEEHDGHVEAYSDGPGQGSEFIVSLPLCPEANLEPHAGDGHLRMRNITGIPPRLVAVVDDVDASARTVAMMLQAIGQSVVTFNDGPSAIEWSLANEPQIMFVDIAMPGMDGYEVARRLREALPNLVLVALTGYGQDDDRRRAFEAGFNHHMVKPVSLEALEQLLAAQPV